MAGTEQTTHATPIAYVRWLNAKRLAHAVLTSQGYRLAEAVAGREGLAQAATLRPDLIVLDLGLPDINGLHVIAQLSR
jgi:two-component system, OmpR family, KDP operon response regulator KdpE